jgi:acyl-CoA dehydrogenase
VLRCGGNVAQVLDEPFMQVAAQTMLPVSHILWSSVWLGLADAAAGTAHAYVRGEARRKPGTSPPAALRLAELLELLEQFRGLRDKAVAQYEDSVDAPDVRDGLTFAIQMNALKTSASKLVVEIAGRAMAICGLAGYREDSPFALGRVLRDAHGAALMVNNERLLGANAQMLLAHKGTW